MKCNVHSFIQFNISIILRFIYYTCKKYYYIQILIKIVRISFKKEEFLNKNNSN